jgi:hypothetical protein
MEEETKLCPECGIVKALSEFPKKKTRKNGYHIRCKVCYLKRQQERVLKAREYVTDW